MYIMEYYSATKWNEIILCETTWIDSEIIIQSEVSQTEKDKYHIISLLYEENGQKWTYVQNRNRFTDFKKNDLQLPKGRGGRERDKLGAWDMFIKHINNKDWLYTTEKSTQYYIITYMGKEWKYVCL